MSSITRKSIVGRSIRWDDERAKAAYGQGHWVRTTLVDALIAAVNEEPDRVVVIERSHSLTVSELYSQASRLAAELSSRYPLGSVISFMLPNWYEAAIIYVAITMSGMVAHPILPSLRAHDLRFMLADVNSRVIFVPSSFRRHDYVAMLSEVADALDAKLDVVVLRGDAGPFSTFASFGSILQGYATTPLHLEPDAVQMIMYTSGTTGSPKGVMHSHNSLHALIRQLGEYWHIEPGDSFLVASPISHIGGSIYAFECPLLLGTTAILHESWDPVAAMADMQTYECTHFAGATPFLTGLLAAAQDAGTRLPSLKVFICGGASVPPTLIQEAVTYFENAAVTRVYGSTEVPVTTVGTPDRSDVRHASESDGRAGIAEIKLVEGEVRVRGPQMLVGYLHADDEASVFDADGFYRTGDLGRWMDDLYLVIDGRSKDIIIRNGENISPKELEDLLVASVDISEIAIVGLPNEKTGEQACAVVVAVPGARPSVASIAATLTQHGVAKFKYPERIVLWDELPKNDAGKVLKHRIKERLLQT